MSNRLAANFRRLARRQMTSGDTGLRLTLPDLLSLHGESSGAVLLMLLALLSSIPIAGMGSVLGFVMLALAWRWQQHLDSRILPERLHQVTLSASWSRRCLHFLAWTYLVAHRFLKARWPVMCHRCTDKWWGVWIALMALIILLPLPLGNVLPSFSLVLLSLGWMFRDGLALLVSLVVGASAIAYALAMSHVLIEGVRIGWAWTNQLF